MYQFSAPMPYTKDDIDKLLDINNEVEKSRITSLYVCVTRGCEVFTGFEQPRNFNFEHNDWDYWKKLISYAINKADFIYLLNSPRPLDVENPIFTKQLEKLNLLLTELEKIGVNKLRVASPQLLTYIANHFKNFSLFASTSFEYKTIWEYQNLLYFHPEVKQIVPSHDINKNFKLLKNLKKKYPKTEFELMVNESCLMGCPHRAFHEFINIDKNIILNNEICLSNAFGTYFCNAITHKFPIPSLVVSTHIYPWEIEEYSKIGINKFKLVGRDGFFQNAQNYINSYSMYLKGVDNINNIMDFPLADFTHHLKGNKTLSKITLRNYKKYLPNIKHFIKKGHLCASRCAVDCRYCYNCAEKIQKLYKTKMKEGEKQQHHIPACKIEKFD